MIKTHLFWVLCTLWFVSEYSEHYSVWICVYVDKCSLVSTQHLRKWTIRLTLPITIWMFGPGKSIDNTCRVIRVRIHSLGAFIQERLRYVVRKNLKSLMFDSDKPIKYMYMHMYMWCVCKLLLTIF